MILRSAEQRWRRFYAYYLGATLFNCSAFVLLNAQIEKHTYFPGKWCDTIYLASFAGFTFVAALGRGLTPRPETEAEEKRGSWMSKMAIIAVMSLPVIAVTAVLDHYSPLDVVRFRVIVTVATMFAMAALVFMKQHRLHEQLKQSNEVLQDASMTDPLTGVRNRRFFTATIEGDVAKTLRAYADGHEPTTRDLVFYLVDVDDFKEVNDQHGHDAGDRVLVEMSLRISSAIRNSDVLVRWGGEEFLIVSRYTDRREAEILAARVMQAVGERPYAVNAHGESIRRTCSIGWAAFPWMEQGLDMLGHEEVLSLADRGLQQAKSLGKNRAIGMIASQEGPTPVFHDRVNTSRIPVRALAVAGPQD
jgi:diguanylate cyclase (GGDEF)-like protein